MNHIARTDPLTPVLDCPELALIEFEDRIGQVSDNDEMHDAALELLQEALTRAWAERGHAALFLNRTHYAQATAAHDEGEGHDEDGNRVPAEDVSLLVWAAAADEVDWLDVRERALANGMGTECASLATPYNRSGWY